MGEIEWSLSGIVLAFVSILIVVFAFLFVFGTDYVGLQWFKFIEPQKEDARREVFENSNSYIRSKNQDLLKYYQEWKKADDTGKIGIEAVIRLDYADFPEDKIQSQKLRDFLIEIKY